MSEYAYYVVTFTDGISERIYANRTRVHDGVLSIWTESYGARDFRHFPLANVREWRKEERA